MTAQRRGALSVIPAVLGVLGAFVGIAAGLWVHWYVVEPGDDELISVARALVPDGFTPVSEPGVTGQMSVLLERGSVHVDATSPQATTLGVVATGLQEKGWILREQVDPARTTGRVKVQREDVLATVFVTDALFEDVTTASIQVSRGPTSPSLPVTVALGAAAGIALGLVSGVVVSQALSRSRVRRDGARPV
jgi:hypothetical protein